MHDTISCFSQPTFDFFHVEIEENILEPENAWRKANRYKSWSRYYRPTYFRVIQIHCSQWSGMWRHSGTATSVQWCSTAFWLCNSWPKLLVDRRLSRPAICWPAAGSAAATHLSNAYSFFPLLFNITHVENNSKAEPLNIPNRSSYTIYRTYIHGRRGRIRLRVVIVVGWRAGCWIESSDEST